VQHSGVSQVGGGDDGNSNANCREYASEQKKKKVEVVGVAVGVRLRGCSVGVVAGGLGVH
jgi:hypothetical protein